MLLKGAKIKADTEAYRSKYADLIQSIKDEAHAVQLPDGWKVKSTGSDIEGRKQFVDRIEYTNAAGDVEIVLNIDLLDQDSPRSGSSKVPYYAFGDTSFKHGDKWYTFSAYDKHGSSFSIGEYSDFETLSQIPDALASEEARARAAIERKNKQ